MLTEYQVRKVICPVCGAGSGLHCRRVCEEGGSVPSRISHSARVDRAYAEIGDIYGPAAETSQRDQLVLYPVAEWVAEYDPGFPDHILLFVGVTGNCAYWVKVPIETRPGA